MIRRPVALALSFAVLAIAGVLCGALLRAAPHRRPSRPPVIGAYFHGGVPTFDPALERLLADDLAELVIAADADRRGDSSADALRPKLVDNLRRAGAIDARGGALAGAWRELLDALDRWVDTPVHARGFGALETELRHRAHAVSDQLAALGLGYYLRADVLVQRGVAHAAVFAYRVERVAFANIAGEPHRVLELRRLDRLNLTHAVLGMQADDLGDPVVLLDQIDEFVATHVTPVLRFGAAYPLGDPTLGAAAAAAIRRELSGRDADEVTRLVVATTRRHEARHDFDLDREPPLRVPEALGKLVDVAGEGAFARRTRAELAAYLSQIANDPVTPQLALWNLASIGSGAGHLGSPESYASRVVLDGLERELGVTSALNVTRASDDDLRTAARALWHDLYGEPYAPIVDAW